MPNIKLSFTFTEHLTQNNTRDNVEGIETAVINTGDGPQIGKMVDVQKLSQVIMISNELYATSIPLATDEYDLKDMLKGDAGGKEWLERFDKLFMDTFKETIPTQMKVQCLPYHGDFTYKAYPQNYAHMNRYLVPEGILEHLDGGAQYLEIIPPMNWADGEYVQQVIYNRSIEDDFFNSYSIRDPREGNPFIQARGLFLGKINTESIRLRSRGHFEGKTSLDHYFEMAYPITIRDTENNPVSIKFTLEE